jgi:hypothetical protein
MGSYFLVFVASLPFLVVQMRVGHNNDAVQSRQNDERLALGNERVNDVPVVTHHPPPYESQSQEKSTSKVEYIHRKR